MKKEPVEPRPGLPEDYWSIVIRQFRKRKVSVVGLWIVLGLFFVAFAADFLANDKPLIMKYRGSYYLPVVKDYGVWLGITQWQPQFQNIVFKEFTTSNFEDGDWAVFPPIKYSPNNVDLFSAIQPPSSSHLLGTDTVGRDIASRMVHGSRVSLSVGFVAVSIYVLIGVLIGAMA